MVMAHGMKAKPGDGGSPAAVSSSSSSSLGTATKTGIGSRRIFPPQFKLQVLDSYRRDADCKGNQRATARKYGIHRRQIQKWLQAESNLRNSVVTAANNNNNCILVNKNALVGGGGGGGELRTSCLMALEAHRQRDDSAAVATTRVAAALSRSSSSGASSIQQPRLSPVRPVLSPAMATHTDIASPAIVGSGSGAHAHMPMDLSVRPRPTAAPAPQQQQHHVHASRSPSLSPPYSRTSRSRSRSRSPLRVRTQPTHRHSVIIPPCASTSPGGSSSSSSGSTSSSSGSTSSRNTDPPEIWDLSSKKTHIESPPPTKPLFKPYLLDDEDSKTATTIPSTPAPMNTTTSRYGYDYAPYYGYSNLYETNVDVGYVFDESGVLQPAYLRPFTTLGGHQPTHHQRATYALDFKLRLNTIDACHLADEGRQRQSGPITTKFNVQRRLSVDKHIT